MIRAEFSFDEVSATLTNTGRDVMARQRFMEVLNVPPVPLLTDSRMVSWSRSFSIIAGHSRNVRGLVGEREGANGWYEVAWTPPSMFDSPEVIRANAELFFDAVPYDSDLLVTWITELNTFLFGNERLAKPEEQREAGQDDDEAFLAKTGSESGVGSSVAPPSGSEKPTLTPTRSPKQLGKRRRS